MLIPFAEREKKLEEDQLYEEDHEFSFESVEDEDEIPECRCGWPNQMDESGRRPGSWGRSWI